MKVYIMWFLTSTNEAPELANLSMIGKAPLTASIAGSISFLIKFSKAIFYSYLLALSSAMVALIS